ncbi:MAG: histidine kinase, partial [Alphaproteobacteria bacterium]
MALARSTIFRFAALVFLLQLAGAGLLLGTVRLLTHHQITAEAEAQADDLRGALMADYRRGGLPALATAVGQELAPARAQGRVLLLVDGQGQVLAGNLAEWPPSLVPGGASSTLELFRVGREESERIYASAVPLDEGARLLVGHV